MVPQQQPYSAQIWGFCDPASSIALQLQDAATKEGVQHKQSATDSDSIWLVQLDQMPASNTSFTITATCSTQTQSIWLCSATCLCAAANPMCSSPWSVASNESIGCANWPCFSAVCWFTALQLFVGQVRVSAALLDAG